MFLWKYMHIYIYMGAFHGIISYPLLLRGPRKARAPIYIYICVCICMCVCVYICVYIRVYVCTYVFFIIFHLLSCYGRIAQYGQSPTSQERGEREMISTSNSKASTTPKSLGTRAGCAQEAASTSRTKTSGQANEI